MAEIEKTVLKEVSAKNDTGGLETPVSVGADFENVIDTRDKHGKHYTLEQFFDHYMNFMTKADFVYRGDTKPRNHHTRIWIDTNEPIQEYHDPQPVYYAINSLPEGRKEVIFSSSQISGDIKYGLVPTTNISSYLDLPWGSGAEGTKKVTIKGEIYPSTVRLWFCRHSAKDLVFDGLERINVSAVKDMSYCFYHVSALINSNNLKQWNTSNVTNLKKCFSNCEYLEDVKGLKNWDTSNVTDLSGCFEYCKHIKSLEPINNWNVSKVTDFTDCFYQVNCPKPSWI